MAAKVDIENGPIPDDPEELKRMCRQLQRRAKSLRKYWMEEKAAHKDFVPKTQFDSAQEALFNLQNTLRSSAQGAAFFDLLWAADGIIAAIDWEARKGKGGQHVGTGPSLGGAVRRMRTALNKLRENNVPIVSKPASLDSSEAAAE